MSATAREEHDAVALHVAERELRTDHTTIAAALVAALEELTVVEAGRTADAGSYTYKYADLGDIVKRTRPVLARHGLVALTGLHDHGDLLAVTVTFLHTTGQSMEFGPLTFPRGNNAQATGSAITYHRRYALIAALGMAAGDDDDGAAASRHVPQGPPPASDEDREAMLAAVTELDDEGKTAVKDFMQAQRIPSLRKTGATDAQLNALDEFLETMGGEK